MMIIDFVPTKNDTLAVISLKITQECNFRLSRDKGVTIILTPGKWEYSKIRGTDGEPKLVLRKVGGIESLARMGRKKKMQEWFYLKKRKATKTPPSAPK